MEGASDSLWTRVRRARSDGRPEAAAATQQPPRQPGAAAWLNGAPCTCIPRNATQLPPGVWPETTTQAPQSHRRLPPWPLGVPGHHLLAPPRARGLQELVIPRGHRWIQGKGTFVSDQRSSQALQLHTPLPLHPGTLERGPGPGAHPPSYWTSATLHPPTASSSGLGLSQPPAGRHCIRQLQLASW